MSFLPFSFTGHSLYGSTRTIPTTGTCLAISGNGQFAVVVRAEGTTKNYYDIFNLNTGVLERTLTHTASHTLGSRAAFNYDGTKLVISMPSDQVVFNDQDGAQINYYGSVYFYSPDYNGFSGPVDISAAYAVHHHLGPDPMLYQTRFGQSVALVGEGKSPSIGTFTNVASHNFQLMPDNPDFVLWGITRELRYMDFTETWKSRIVTTTLRIDDPEYSSANRQSQFGDLISTSKDNSRIAVTSAFGSSLRIYGTQVYLNEFDDGTAEENVAPVLIRTISFPIVLSGGVSLSQNGSRVAFMHRNSGLKVYDVGTGQQICLCEGTETGVWRLTSEGLTPDATKLLAYDATSKRAVVFDATTGKIVSIIQDCDTAFISNDWKKIVIGRSGAIYSFSI